MLFLILVPLTVKILEMAGVVPSHGKSSGRKQWTLHDGPQGSLRRLRNQLAEDGCPESQVVLAKQLLNEQCENKSLSATSVPELDIDKNENARIAVYWLIKASEQGNTEATNLLKKCFYTKNGINDCNYLDVKTCINMTQDEKLARKAAREMFASLAKGEDFITSKQLEKRMLEIYNSWRFGSHRDGQGSSGHCGVSNSAGRLLDSHNDLTQDSEDEINESDKRNEKLTEEHLVSAAVNYSHGELPLVNRCLCLTGPNLQAVNHVPYFYRYISFPRLTLYIQYYKLLQLLGKKPIFSFFPFAESSIQFLVFLLVYLLVGIDTAFFLPVTLYHISFVTMIISTFQMLQACHEFQDFRVWSGLFITYSGGSLNPAEAEYQYIVKNLKPYGHFFLALLIHFMIYPTIASQWIPQSEFTVVAICLTFLTLVQFMNKSNSRRCLSSQLFANKPFPDLFILFSFAINVLAKYPYESDLVVTQTWRFLDLKIPTFTSYVIGNGIEFCLTFRVLFFLLIPSCFVKLAMREHFRGIYKYLIPHCVTLSWLQIAIINSQGATTYGLIRGTFALVGAVLFLPLVGLATVLLPIVALVNYIHESNLLMTVGLGIAFTTITLGVSWILMKTNYSRFVTLFQVSMALLSSIFLLYSFLKSNSDSMNQSDIYEKSLFRSTLSWEQYQNYCHQPSWEQENMASVQVKCSQLDGHFVRWEGYVTDIRVNGITNVWKTVITKLPNFLQNYLFCLYGEKYSCNDFNCQFEKQLLRSDRKCHLEMYNKYDFAVSVNMLSGIWSKGAEVILKASYQFQNFTLGLKVGDKIWFSGLLTNNDGELLGGLKPHLNLMEIGCIACRNVELVDVKIVTVNINFETICNYVYTITKYIMNFLFYPMLIIK